MGLTAEEVAKRYDISRKAQDEFAFHSHRKAAEAIKNGNFKDGVVPIEVEEVFLNNGKRDTRKFTVDTDEGVRSHTKTEVLAKLRPVFAQGGSVTAGNSSQTSDGAAFAIVMSEKMVNELGLKPIARLVSYAAVGLEPKIMGMGPVKAIPKALAQAGMTLNDIEQIELNEAFASQSVAVVRELGINPDLVNVNGGAIALGHPLGCTGAKLSVQLFNEMKKRNQKYGMVTMCVGTGQGAAGVYEII
jgi:acetyl-CoA acyltransferase